MFGTDINDIFACIIPKAFLLFVFLLGWEMIPGFLRRMKYENSYPVINLGTTILMNNK